MGPSVTSKCSVGIAIPISVLIDQINEENLENILSILLCKKYEMGLDEHKDDEEEDEEEDEGYRYRPSVDANGEFSRWMVGLADKLTEKKKGAEVLKSELIDALIKKNWHEETLCCPVLPLEELDSWFRDMDVTMKVASLNLSKMQKLEDRVKEKFSWLNGFEVRLMLEQHYMA
jgi:hypothetical protein